MAAEDVGQPGEFVVSRRYPLAWAASRAELWWTHIDSTMAAEASIGAVRSHRTAFGVTRRLSRASKGNGRAAIAETVGQHLNL